MDGGSAPGAATLNPTSTRRTTSAAG